MTVETSSAQNTSRPAASADCKHARGKPGVSAQGASGMGDFMAILASVDTVELVPTAPDTATSLLGDAPLLGGDATTAGLPMPDPNDMTLKALRALGAGRQSNDVDTTDVLSDVSLSSPYATDIDKLLRGIEGDRVGATLPDPSAASVQSGGPLDAAALLALSVQGMATAVPAAQTPSSNPVTGVLASVSGERTRLHSGAMQEGEVSVRADSVSGDLETPAKAGKSQKDTAARLATLQAAAAAAATPDQTGSQTDPRQVALQQKSGVEPMTPIAAALATATMVAPVRREELTRERTGFRSGVGESAGVSQSYQPSTAGISAPMAPEAPTPTDLYVAEKVAYWISSDVQNAEMKLDGIGDKPVEVSIRMQGNEAHIAFRSDELQARAALENASEHLKDMLQREGLVLSGVSVGTSSAGDPGQRERDSRQGARPSGIASVQPALPGRVSGAARGSAGVVDLFV